MDVTVTCDEVIREVTRGGSKGGRQGNVSPVRSMPHCLLFQNKRNLSAFAHLEWKLSNHMLVTCQKLHIWTYDWQIFSGDRPPFGDLCFPTGPQAEGNKTIAGSDMCCACVIVRTPLSANLWMHVQSQMSVWTCKRRIRMWNLLLLRALQGINLVCHCELTLILVTTLLNFTKFCASWLLP